MSSKRWKIPIFIDGIELRVVPYSLVISPGGVSFIFFLYFLSLVMRYFKNGCGSVFLICPLVTSKRFIKRVIKEQTLYI